MNRSKPRRSILDRLLTVFMIEPGEGPRSFIMFLYFFLVIFSYYLIKPASRAIMMEAFGAGKMPLGNFSTALIIGFAVVGFDFLAGRLKRQNLVLVLTGMAISALIIFRFGFTMVSGEMIKREIALAYFVFGDIFSVMWVTLFWSLTHEMFTSTEGKRLYGFIGGGGAAGGAMGGIVVGWFSPRFGAVNLSLLAIAPLIITVFLAFYIVRFLPPDAPTTPTKPKNKSHGIDGMKLILGSRYLQAITLLLGITVIVGLVIETQFNLAVEEAISDTDGRASFMGFRNTQLTVVQFTSQVLLTGPLVRLFGIRGVLFILPMGNLLMGMFFFFSASLAVVNWAKIYEGSVKYGTNQATKEMLYLPTSTEEKYQAKAFIDVFFYRIAKGLGAIFLLFCTQIAHLSKISLFWPLAVLCISWIGTIVWINSLYNNQVSKRIVDLFPDGDPSLTTADLGPRQDIIDEAFGGESIELDRAGIALLKCLPESKRSESITQCVLQAFNSKTREGISLGVEWLKTNLPQELEPFVPCFSPRPPSSESRRKLIEKFASNEP